MRVVATNQLTFELQPGLLQRFASLRDCVQHTVLNDPRGMKAVAADCDLSLSELSRRLNPSEGEPRSCDVNLMVKVMESTNDYSPIHWLMAKFLRDSEARKSAAVEQLAQFMPVIATLLADAGVAMPKGARR